MVVRALTGAVRQGPDCPPDDTAPTDTASVAGTVPNRRWPLNGDLVTRARPASPYARSRTTCWLSTGRVTAL
jgi:hypothetical protein